MSIAHTPDEARDLLVDLSNHLYRLDNMTSEIDGVVPHIGAILFNTITSKGREIDAFDIETACEKAANEWYNHSFDAFDIETACEKAANEWYNQSTEHVQSIDFVLEGIRDWFNQFDYDEPEMTECAWSGSS